MQVVAEKNGTAAPAAGQGLRATPASSGQSSATAAAAAPAAGEADGTTSAAAAPKPAAPAKPAPRPGMAGKKPLISRKPAVKAGGGLGVKKMTTKVDDSLFDQNPAEAPPPLPVGATATPEAEKQGACS